MKVPTASAPQANPKQYWLNSRGTWLVWFFSIAILHFLLLSMPFFTTPTVWTLTHVIHNVVWWVTKEGEGDVERLRGTCWVLSF